MWNHCVITVSVTLPDTRCPPKRPIPIGGQSIFHYNVLLQQYIPSTSMRGQLYTSTFCHHNIPSVRTKPTHTKLDLNFFSMVVVFLVASCLVNALDFITWQSSNPLSFHLETNHLQLVDQHQLMYRSNKVTTTFCLHIAWACLTVMLELQHQHQVWGV